MLRAVRADSLEISDSRPCSRRPLGPEERRRDDPLLHERLDAMLSLRTGRQSGIAPPVGVMNRILVRQFDRVVTSRFAMREFRQVAAAAGTAVTGSARRRPGHLPPPEERAVRPTSCAWSTWDGSPVRRAPTWPSPPPSTCTGAAYFVRLDVYGTGPHRDELEEIAADAPVTFHGHVADRDELAGADRRGQHRPLGLPG